MKIYPKTAIVRLICDTKCCCLKCSKERPYSVSIEHRQFNSFTYLIHIKNRSKKKIRRFTIQMCKANQGFHLRPLHKTKFDENVGVVTETRGDFRYKIEINPRQIFTFELNFIPIHKEMTKTRCIVCYVNKNCEDRDMEAIATGDHTGLRLTKFIKMSDW